MYPTLKLASLLATFAANPTEQVTVNIGNARVLILKSKGAETWTDAGEGWARLVANPNGFRSAPL